ncbi:pyridoxal phosphate-dependent aminotransferase [Terriglobus tenax]|uniref:pyridoxal phosphate-dependent aminotransferase n=1 Tax=Terriglobus tenax TaxID=1111115 RepID=UPI0021E0F344|nr:pyridoxal phosphate-dependent aminotransferase [Terriglobus tenax]
MFSERTSWDLSESAYAAALRRARAEGSIVADLTRSNPTECGFSYDAETILGALSQPGAMRYDPDARGIASARAAASGYYAGHGITADPADLILTTSTSEAYSYLFRLLCDPGDEVLVPQPSYPLFDFLAGLDNVRLLPYPLFHDHGWHIDLAALETSIGPRTRAVMVVHPNNPTGHFTGDQQRLALEQICARHSLALIVDEVFLDYPVEKRGASFANGEHPALTFVLSGMSKIAGLPQMKSAWLLALGPNDLRQQALARLEVIADTFLSMNAPTQHALPVWLQLAGKLQTQIAERVRHNLSQLDQHLGAFPQLSRLPVEAGWVAVLRLPAIEDDTALAVRLLQQAGVLTHPGSFYGFPPKGWLVISLLPSAQEFEAGIASLTRI